MKFIESSVRTKKLYCSDCRNRLRVGESVIFQLENGKMENVFCDSCKGEYEKYVDYDDTHPLDLDE